MLFRSRLLAPQEQRMLWLKEAEVLQTVDRADGAVLRLGIWLSPLLRRKLCVKAPRGYNYGTDAQLEQRQRCSVEIYARPCTRQIPFKASNVCSLKSRRQQIRLYRRELGVGSKQKVLQSRDQASAGSRELVTCLANNLCKDLSAP